MEINEVEIHENLIISSNYMILKKEFDAEGPRTIAFMHNHLGTKNNDIYLIDSALALCKAYNVTIFTSNYDKDAVREAFPFLEAQIKIKYSAWWLPNSIFGMLGSLMSHIKSIWTAARMVLFPPWHRPDIIILDTELVSLPILWLGSYKTVYIKKFPNLQEFPRISLNFMGLHLISFADKILVQSNSLKTLLQHSHPRLASKVDVLYPCYDTEVWTKNSVNLKLILPDILVSKPCIFLAIGKFKKQTNFNLLLKAADEVFEALDQPCKNIILIIAGNYHNNIEDTPHYSYLIHNAAKSVYASQINFITYVTPGHMKSLIETCTILVHLKTHNLHASASILTAMSMWKPIIAMKSGFASDVLSHNVNAFLVEPNPLDLAKGMIQLANDVELQHKLSSNAYTEFTSRFSYKKYQTFLKEITANLSE